MSSARLDRRDTDGSRREWRPTRAATRLLLVCAIALCACGGDSPDDPQGPAEVSTLAYVRTECRNVSDGITLQQDLNIVVDNHAPIQVAATGLLGTIHFPEGCTYAASNHTVGTDFVVTGAFQRLGVSPDGSTVVFEVSGDNSLYPIQVPEASKGIFAVAADGSGLRRLGPPSREPPFFNAATTVFPNFAFSPNGRTVAYTDRGPGPDGEDAIQIVTLDIVNGRRTQVTRLPPSPFETCCPTFMDDNTIAFRTSADADGRHPDGVVINVIIGVDGSGLQVPSDPVPLPGAKLVENFIISGARVHPVLFEMPGLPVNGHPESGPIQEVFLLDGSHVLQLSTFRRNDVYDPVLSPDGESIVFIAAADPLGSNPKGICQLFSIDRLGKNLRQLTSFDDEHSGNGCLVGTPPNGCIAHFLSRDLQSDALVFYSDCDPFGTGVSGGQIFAMRADGSGLRQLTATRGSVPTDANGALYEVPGPFAYPGAVR